MSRNTVANHENHLLSSQDALTDLLRTGAQRLIAQAIENGMDQMLAENQTIRTITSHRAVVRNGFIPKRQILTGIGTVDYQVPKMRDRSENGMMFTLRSLPLDLHRAATINELPVLLYLKGISAGDMQKALTTLVGHDAQGLPSSAVSLLRSTWLEKCRG